MMSKVSWVEKLVGQVSEVLFIFPGGHRPMTMKDPPMRRVFSKGPQRNAQQKENQSLVGMPAAQSQHQHDYGKSRIESSNRIEFASRNSGLPTFVSADGKDAMTT